MPDSGATFAISAPSIFDGAHFLCDHGVIIESETVLEILPRDELPPSLQQTKLETGTLAPGLIDLQVNGGGDLLFNNKPCEHTLNTMLQAHRARGTTAMMPTLISATRGIQEQAVAAVRAARANGNPGILGIHLEGPFFELGKRGVHDAEMIRKVETEDIDWLCSLADLNVIVTLAPEHAAPGQIRALTASGIQVCAGHSDASFAQIEAAVAEGLAGVTHLFNAMSQMTAREPGLVGACLIKDSLWAGIIADGHHVHPANLRLAQQSKPAGRLVLVSDAMATVGGSSGAFSLYGQEVRLNDDKLVNAAGVLAGSAIGMMDAVAYTVRSLGLPLEEGLRMASRYPAAILGLEHQLGRIARGYRADLVHFDDRFAVHNTWLAGEHRQHL